MVVIEGLQVEVEAVVGNLERSGGRIRSDVLRGLGDGLYFSVVSD